MTAMNKIGAALLAFALLIVSMNYLIMNQFPSPNGNSPPVADAGPDQTVSVGQTVYFDGSGSYDPDGLLVIDKNIQVNDASGSQWQSPPSIGADSSGDIYVVWEDYRTGGFDIYSSHKAYDESVFSTNVLVNDDVIPAKQSRPCLAAEPSGKLHVVWEDFRNKNWDVYYANSTDGGLSFGANLLVTTQSTDDWQNDPSVAVDFQGTVHVVWEDNRDGNWSIYYANSLDGFADNTRVSDGLLPGNQWTASIVVGSDGTIHVVWEANADVHYSRSTNGGLTFGPSRKLNDDGGNATQGKASIAVEDGGGVHVAWEDTRLGDSDIFYTHSTDNGISFSPNVKVNDDVSGEGQGTPAVAVEDGEFVHLAWADAREGNWDIYYTTSYDGGSSFQPNSKVNDDPLKRDWQTRPSIVAEDGGYFHVAWKDSRNKPSGLLYDVFYAKGKVSRLFYNWEFDDGSPTASGMKTSHVYLSPGAYNVTLTVTDEQGESDTDNCTITVLQDFHIPTADANGPYFALEGSPITLDGSGSSDPDNDTLEFRWDLDNDGNWDTPWSASPYLNYTWGDDYSSDIALQVSDGQSTDTDTATVKVSNAVPEIAPFGPFTVNEGIPLAISATSVDPGSDDLNFTWEFELGSVIMKTHFNDGVGPDPFPSPGGLYPFTITDSFDYTYGDNGVFNVTLSVEDDDGGYASFMTTITVINVAPEIVPFGPIEIEEGSQLDLTATSTDLGSDDLTFTWELELGPVESNTYFNDGAGFDPYPSPGGLFPFTATDAVHHIYGDNGIFNVTLTVEDDDGGIATYTTTITVANIEPTVNVEAYILVNFTLRVAGEKWHNVEMFVYADNETIGYAEVVRYPGNPDEQSATKRVKCDVTRTITLRVIYTPLDDPISGTINGANPAWVFLTFDDGSVVRLKHTFNVQHPLTWKWSEVINPFFVGHEITFEANATDPGSDDLTLTWSWGDGTFDESSMYYNDGVGPDPYPSPDVNPMKIAEVRRHTYSKSGTYTFTLAVEDDDGGIGIKLLKLIF